MSRVQSSSSASTVGIKDTSGNPLTSTSGALDVNIASSTTNGTTLSNYNEVTNVAMGATVSILSYTVPTGQTLNVSQILTSSDSIGVVVIEMNGAVNGKIRFSYATGYNESVNYNNYEAVAGTVLTILGTNNSLQGVASFNATLQGVLVS